MANRIQSRRDTKENWLKYDPILLEGEVGYEIDTNLQKIGNGVDSYSNLEYVGIGNITQETGDSEKLVISQKAVTELIEKLSNFIKNINKVYQVDSVESQDDEPYLNPNIFDKNGIIRIEVNDDDELLLRNKVHEVLTIGEEKVELAMDGDGKDAGKITLRTRELIENSEDSYKHEVQITTGDDWHLDLGYGLSNKRVSLGRGYCNFHIYDESGEGDYVIQMNADGNNVNISNHKGFQVEVDGYERFGAKPDGDTTIKNNAGKNVMLADPRRMILYHPNGNQFIHSNPEKVGKNGEEADDWFRLLYPNGNDLLWAEFIPEDEELNNNYTREINFRTPWGNNFAQLYSNLDGSNDWIYLKGPYGNDVIGSDYYQNDESYDFNIYFSDGNNFVESEYELEDIESLHIYYPGSNNFLLESVHDYDDNDLSTLSLQYPNGDSLLWGEYKYNPEGLGDTLDDLPQVESGNFSFNNSFGNNILYGWRDSYKDDENNWYQTGGSYLYDVNGDVIIEQNFNDIPSNRFRQFAIFYPKGEFNFLESDISWDEDGNVREDNSVFRLRYPNGVTLFESSSNPEDNENAMLATKGELYKALSNSGSYMWDENTPLIRVGSDDNGDMCFVIQDRYGEEVIEIGKYFNGFRHNGTEINVDSGLRIEIGGELGKEGQALFCNGSGNIIFKDIYTKDQIDEQLGAIDEVLDYIIGEQ